MLHPNVDGLIKRNETDMWTRLISQPRTWLVTVLPLARISVLIGIVSLVSVGIESSSADEWTDVSGTRTMIAEFAGIWGDKAVFVLPDGRRKPVELKNLQAESRLRALDLAEANKQHLADVKAEIIGRAEAERAMGPQQIGPAEIAAPAYQPLPAKPSLETTVSHLNGQIRNGHLRVIWDALPKKYQTDLEALAIDFGKNMDPALWQDTVGSLDRITRLLAGRERWIFSHPRIGQMVAKDEATMRSGYQAMLGMIQALIDPQQVSLERLQQGNLGQLIAQQDDRLSGHLYLLQNMSGSTSNPDFEVKPIDDTHATLIMKLPADAPRGTPPPPPTKMQLVDGRWVPEEMAKSWDEDIAAAKQKIAELPQTSEMLRFAMQGFSQSVDQYLGPLETADSRDAFHDQIDRMIADLAVVAVQAMGQMNQGGGSGGMSDPYGMPGSEGPSYGSESSGYGSERGSPMGMPGEIGMPEGAEEMESYGSENGRGSGNMRPQPR